MLRKKVRKRKSKNLKKISNGMTNEELKKEVNRLEIDYNYNKASKKEIGKRFGSSTSQSL